MRKVAHIRQHVETKLAISSCMEGERLTGILSINDVVKETILTHQENISHLQTYIHS